MAWKDLGEDIARLFSDIRFDFAEGSWRRDSRAATSKPFGTQMDDRFRDPHADADWWIRASAEERERRAPHFVALLEQRRRNIVLLEKRRRESRKRNRAEYMRELRAKSAKVRETAAKNRKAWLARNPDARERARQNARAWREKQKGAPLRKWTRRGG